MSQKLKSPARVGNTIFQTGIDYETVVERAQREYRYHEREKLPLFPCGDFYPNASSERDCTAMLIKPCASCMFNKSKAELSRHL